MQDAQADRRSTTPDDSEATPKKFRLASDLSQTVNTSQIGEKIMDTPVQLSMREILAVSSEVSSYLHDQTRKRRVPIDAPTTIPAVANTTDMSSSVLTPLSTPVISRSYMHVPPDVQKLPSTTKSMFILFWIMARNST